MSFPGRCHTSWPLLYRRRRMEALRLQCRPTASVRGSMAVKAGPILEADLASTSPASRRRRRPANRRRQRRASPMTRSVKGLVLMVASGTTADLVAIPPTAGPAISRARTSSVLESAATTMASVSERAPRASRRRGGTIKKEMMRQRGVSAERISTRSITRNERRTSTYSTVMGWGRRQAWTTLSEWSTACTSPQRSPGGWRRSWCESEVIWSGSSSAGAISAGSSPAPGSALRLRRQTVGRWSWSDRDLSEISATDRIRCQW
mmetsp:Transcript_21127/g.53772  ORF Transcript_21127/g.53772 Transcript_21127/m.53772 type:complete len:263 (+) Transcript_21127:851-1639(+)